MKILHVGLPNLPADCAVGGAVERRMRVLAAKHAELGHEVILVSPEHESFATVQRLEIPGAVDVQRVDITSRGYPGQIQLGRAALARARASCVDVVHVHNATGIAWSLRRADEFATFLSIDYGTYRWERSLLRPFWSWQLSRFDVLLPVSRSTESMLRAKWPRLRYRVLYNLVDEYFFSPRPVDDRYREAGFVFGFLGRINEQKGADLLARAFAEVRANEPDVALFVAGPSGTFGFEHEDPCVEELRGAGAHLLGPLVDTDLPTYLSSIDCLVVPTRRDERFGMVAAEAMACDCPVVSSGDGGLPEVVDRRAGINATTEARSIALAMQLMITHRRTGTTAYAPRQSSSRFWAGTIAEEALNIYREFLSARRAR